MRGVVVWFAVGIEVVMPDSIRWQEKQLFYCNPMIPRCFARHRYADWIRRLFSFAVAIAVAIAIDIAIAIRVAYQPSPSASPFPVPVYIAANSRSGKRRFLNLPFSFDGGR